MPIIEVKGTKDSKLKLDTEKRPAKGCIECLPCSLKKAAKEIKSKPVDPAPSIQASKHAPQKAALSEPTPPVAASAAPEPVVTAPPEQEISITAEPEPAPMNPAVEERRKKRGQRRRVVVKRFAGVVFCCAALLLTLYAISPKGYSVETKLLFVTSDTKLGAVNPMEKEIDLLKSPAVALMMAQARPRTDSPARGESRVAAGEENTEWKKAATSSEGEETNRLAEKFGGPSDFMSWLSENMQIKAEVDGNKAVAKVKLTGDDPELLKEALNNYVLCYSDYRRSLDGASGAANSRVCSEGSAFEALNDQLQKLDVQYRECDLALQLISSRKGVFSGFIPEGQVNTVPSLAQFQKRIVDLEISKRALNVKFQPNSREIKSVNAEILQVREAMKECLSEHLYFLKKGKELLLAQQNDLERKAGAEGKCPKDRYSGKLPNGDAWYRLTGGLQVIQDKPVVTWTPLTVQADRIKAAVARYIIMPLNSAELRFFFQMHCDPIETVIESPQEGESSPTSCESKIASAQPARNSGILRDDR